MTHWETEERYDSPGKRADELRRERDRLNEEYIAMEERVESIEEECTNLRDDRDRLREAIETHRRNVWGGDGCEVGHYEDEQLYAALQGAGDG